MGGLNYSGWEFVKNL